MAPVLKQLLGATFFDRPALHISNGVHTALVPVARTESDAAAARIGGSLAISAHRSTSRKPVKDLSVRLGHLDEAGQQFLGNRVWERGPVPV